MYTILYIQCTQLTIKYTIFLGMYTIMYILSTQFFKECTQLYIFKIYDFLKNVYNSIYSMYTINYIF